MLLQAKLPLLLHFSSKSPHHIVVFLYCGLGSEVITLRMFVCDNLFANSHIIDDGIREEFKD